MNLKLKKIEVLRFEYNIKNIELSGFYYKSPSNLNYLWNFGVVSLYFLLSQIITGILLAMFYNPDINFVFSTVFDITNEIIMDGYCVDYMLMGLHFFSCCLFSYDKFRKN